MFVEDLRHSIRGLARAKGVTALLLVSLGLGTGANAAVYGIAESLLFRGPAGVGDASALVDIYTSQMNGTAFGRFSFPDFLALGTATSFERVAASTDAIEAVRLDTVSQRVRVARVTDGFFPSLRIEPAAGDLLDQRASRDSGAAVISFALWDLFGHDPAIVGRTLRIAERDYTIIGVAPPGFRGLHVGAATDAWLPLDAAPAQSARGNRHLRVIGRLRPGVRLAAAQAELDGLATRLAAEFPETNRGTLSSPDEPRRMSAVAYSPMDPASKAQASAIGAIIFGATVLLLVSACINAGSLLLSRAVARRRELAVKLALGASRAQLIGHFVTESLFISLAGGALGLLFAFWTSGAIPALFAPEHAAMLDTRLHLPIVMLTVAVSCVAGVLFSIAPAMHAMRSLPIDALRGDAGSVSDAGGRTWLRGALVIAQVGLSTVLVIATALLVQGLNQALQGDFGLSARHIAITAIDTPGGMSDPARGLAYQAEVLKSLQAWDGVEAAGWVVTLPAGRGTRREIAVESSRPGVSESAEVNTNIVSPGYFQAMKIPLVEGRLFDGGDTGLAPPVVIVNDTFAARYFAASTAGHRLHDPQGATFTIVGVVRSGKYRALQDAPEPTVYYPIAQEYAPHVHLVARTSHDPIAVLEPVRDFLPQLDRDVIVARSFTLDEHLSEALAIERLTTTLVAICGLVALALAAIGVYAVMTDAVQRRTREIGLRIALGARWAQILRLVFASAMTLTLSGVVAGVIGALALARILRSAASGGLPQVDVTTLVAVPAALAIVVVAAAVLPTRRALRVSPTVALRVE